MELQEINVFIEKNGQVKIEIQGVQGTSCLDLTKELEAILGGEVIERELTFEAQELIQTEIQEKQWQWS